MERESLIRGPRALWDALRERGGLDLDYHADMDGDILSALEPELDDPSLTTERFIGALLKALTPFTRMLSDLLALFERAGARTTDASLAIEFNFDNTPTLAFDLRNFRDWLAQLETVRHLITVRTWTYEQLWALNRLLSDQRGSMPPAAERWLQSYRIGRFDDPDELPPPDDPLLRQVFTLWTNIVRATITITRDRGELPRFRGDEAAGDGWPPGLLARIDNDHWAASMLELIYGAAASSWPGLRAELEAFLATVPSITTEEDRVIETLTAFLNLPIWKQRNELYSAWLLTLIDRALEPHGLTLHVDGGRLSFGFGGSHLGSVYDVQPSLHVWAELRHRLPKRSRVSGRTSIQPDYTLIADPMTGRESGVAVVEVKQYRRHAQGNFSEAMIDYAAGHPRAGVFLASYGPVKEDFLDTFDAATAPRIHPFGGLRPHDEKRRDEFCDALRRVVDERYPRQPRLESVTLTWGQLPSDLDLRLGIDDGLWAIIDYRAKGSHDDYPWAQLDQDVQRLGGSETITLTKTLGALYRCVVENYSNEGPLRASVAEVRIHHGGTSTVVNCPSTGEGRRWHVFDFDGRTGQLELVNRITDHDLFTSTS